MIIMRKNEVLLFKSLDLVETSVRSFHIAFLQVQVIGLHRWYNSNNNNAGYHVSFSVVK